jgi:hypothetical protein
MENIKESKKTTYMRVQNVMKLMNCSKSTAYERMGIATCSLENRKSIVGVQITVAEFVFYYEKYTIEQCLQAIEDTPIDVKPFKRK